MKRALAERAKQNDAQAAASASYPPAISHPKAPPAQSFVVLSSPRPPQQPAPQSRVDSSAPPPATQPPAPLTAEARTSTPTPRPPRPAVVSSSSSEQQELRHQQEQERPQQPQPPPRKIPRTGDSGDRGRRSPAPSVPSSSAAAAASAATTPPPRPSGAAPASAASRPSPVPTPQPSSSSTQPQRHPQPPRSSSAPASSSSSSRPSSSKKRQRSSPVPSSSSAATPSGRGNGSSDENDDEDAMSAFYLRHQNKALASELKGYKRRIDLLERERAHRRSQCHEARRSVDKIDQVWRGMEVGVSLGVRRLRNKDNGAGGNEHEQPQRDNHIKNELSEQIQQKSDDVPRPASTGSGVDVETVGSLLDSISRLAEEEPTSAATALKKEEDDDDEDLIDEDEVESRNEKQSLDEMARVLSSVASRADAFEGNALQLLRHVLDADAGAATDGAAAAEPDVVQAVELRKRIAELESAAREADSRMEELSKARDDANASERRVRRGLYRLATGRMKIGEVLKAVEKDDNGASFMESFEMLENMERQAHTSSAGAADLASSHSIAPLAGEGEAVDSAEVAQLRKNLQDAQAISESREQQINEIISEREGLLKRINTLVASVSDKSSGPEVSEEDVKRSTLYTTTLAKLTTTERKVKELEEAGEKMKQKWAVTKGDLDLSNKTLAEMKDKHLRRWKELMAPIDVGNAAEPDGKKDANPESNGEIDIEGSGDAEKETISDAKKIVELEHKLKQALEAVRQGETLRVALTEAHKMNETLQTKVDELRTKNAKYAAEKSAARSSADSLSSPQASTHSSHKSSSGGSHSSSSERMQKEHRKMRKELAAALASKEAARTKQERAEKERDSLMKNNARLLKQSSEKDDMNAKSLSTILHLKNVTEELSREKAILEQKTRAAEQLSLAARLAANAKERVEEEAIREKELAEEQLRQGERKIKALQEERDLSDGRLSQSKAQMASIVKDLSKVRQRCDELASECTSKEEEKKRMAESLAVSKKEAMESAKKAATVMANARAKGGVNSEFTMEQLTTQVKFLSDRINCPVCNAREKKCILLRCRHMFCRSCVDENIKNRSRKCPACAQRFDMKDVADVWL